MNCISLSGKIGSGKSSLSSQISELTGMPKVSFGDYVRYLAKKTGRDPGDRSTLQDIGEELVSGDIVGFCWAVLGQSVHPIENGRVIDGVRHVAVLNCLRSIILPSQLIHFHIEVDSAVLEQRLKIRGEEKINLSHSTEVDVVERLSQNADYVLDGSRTIEALSADIRGILSKAN